MLSTEMIDELAHEIREAIEAQIPRREADVAELEAELRGRRARAGHRAHAQATRRPRRILLRTERFRADAADEGAHDVRRRHRARDEVGLRAVVAGLERDALRSHGHTRARPVRPDMRTRWMARGVWLGMTCAVVPALAACGRTELCDLTATSPPADRQFDTDPFSNLNRPDSAIAVGPSHVVTAVNFEMVVQDLNGGNPTTTPIDSTFFTGDPTNSIGDPRLIYDAADDRFIMSFLGFDYPGQKGAGDPGDSWCDLAVSATNDPRGAWNKYSLQVLRNGTEQMDFDSLGYDGQAIYITAHMRDFANGTTFSGNRILIFDKATALAGGSLTPTIVDDLPLPGGAGPADIIKPVEPLDAAALAGPTRFLTESGNDKLVLYTLTDPFGSATFTPTTIPITPWAEAGSAPQPGGGPLLDQGAGAVLQKTSLRDGAIWTAHSPSASGSAGDRAGVIVYKIDPAAGTLTFQHTVDDPSIGYYLPAVVPDDAGNAAVVFAGSNDTTPPSIFYTRVINGVFESPAVVTAGTTAYTSNPGQSHEAWGDYFDAAPDPGDGRELWLHGELPASAITWKMRAARVSTATTAIFSCYAPPEGGEGADRATTSQVFFRMKTWVARSPATCSTHS